MFRLNVNGWFCHLLEYVYSLPEPPPRKRTKPMEVICVGLPRCGTESLQHALLRLGYDHTCHGWDIVLEDPNYCQQWVRLSRKKWFGPLDGENNITAADFDALIGNAVAVTDTASSVFAAEMIAAYPDAKVILNQRKNIDDWHHSITNTIARAEGHWPLFILSCLSRECFWAWHSHFLGKPVPEGEPFPYANAASGWKGKEATEIKRFLSGALQTLGVLGSIAAGVGAIVYIYL
ncbi:hypothetical protein DL771_005093 [Monosporascus sp. 5C6A]|nr:hypothetical protein DL771_005093 [Monosporascus sp. 5C6A]